MRLSPKRQNGTNDIVPSFPPNSTVLYSTVFGVAHSVQAAVAFLPDFVGSSICHILPRTNQQHKTKRREAKTDTDRHTKRQTKAHDPISHENTPPSTREANFPAIHQSSSLEKRAFHSSTNLKTGQEKERKRRIEKGIRNYITVDCTFIHSLPLQS